MITVDLRYYVERGRRYPQFYVGRQPVGPPMNSEKPLFSCLTSVLMKICGQRSSVFRLDNLKGPLELGEIDIPGLSDEEEKRYRAAIELAFSVRNKVLERSG